MHKIKYVMFHYTNDTPDFVIFNRRYIHQKVFDEFLVHTFEKKDYPTKVTAGFISINEHNHLKALGKSESLDVESGEDDTKIINLVLKENQFNVQSINLLDADLISFIGNKQIHPKWRQWYIEGQY